jgi:hypothetical protein
MAEIAGAAAGRAGELLVKDKPNLRSALDARRALCLHIEALRSGASESGRSAL